MTVDDLAIGRLRDAVARTAELTRRRAATGVSHQDADGDAGTIATDDAIGFDPLPLLAALDVAGAHAVVIGQVAGILHGSRELTGDLDLLWDGDPAGIAAMTEAFRASGASLADDDERPIALAPEAFGLTKVLFRTATASGDCCTTRLDWGDLAVADYLSRACVATTASGVRVRYLCLDDLIVMRRAVGRPKDLRRAAELEALRSRD